MVCTLAGAAHYRKLARMQSRRTNFGWHGYRARTRTSLQIHGSRGSLSGLLRPRRLFLGKCAGSAALEKLSRIEPTENLDQRRDEASPPCLVARSKARTVIAVEVFENST